ncbi:MAG: NUDIX domain-containing protein [Bacteroidetes bacterium]|nr:MAG: NUDIX domain-containing protein [Bacteroidota bacterium]
MKTPNSYYISDYNLPLNEYFVFGLSVDCVVFGYHEGEIKVLLIQRDAEPFKGHWALIGDLVEPEKNLRDAANNVLEKLTGLKNIYMKQFFTFGSVDRHPLGRVVTVGYFSLVNSINYHPIASSWAKSAEWFSINDLPELAFDHQSILSKGIETLKNEVRHKPTGFELLPSKFTLLELQLLYEALLGCKFDKSNFRKKILEMDILLPLNEVKENVAHRPAKLFKFDEKRYRLLEKRGFSFEL